MHPEVRRAIVRGFYPGEKWRSRVMAMTDEQVQICYDIKLEQVREKGETDLQEQLRNERTYEAHPFSADQ